MQTVTVTRIVHAPHSTVWALVADVTSIVKWHPSVASVDLLSPEPTGVGAARRCNFHDGTSVREDVTELVEGERLRLVLTEFKLPMKRFEADVAVTPASNGTTQVTFTMNYEIKFGLLGRAMNALVVRGQMNKLIGTVLAGLDHHSATGEFIDRDFVPAAA